MKKDTENLDILLLLKCQPLYRVAPFSVPSLKAESFLFSAVAENRAVEGNLRFLNPSQLSLTAPVRGIPTTPYGRVGRHLGSMSCEHLARECRGADAPSLRLNIG